jgi:hypothetical protein
MIKLTRTENAQTGVTGFVFECNSADDHETLDKLRVAILGDKIPKRGNYSNSNTLVIETKIPVEPLPEPES